MNKYLKQNWKIFDKFKFRPMGSIEDEYPRTINEANEKSREIWTHLVNDELKRHKIYVVKGKKGFNISVVSDEKYVYLIQVVRSEYNIDEITVFINDLTEDNINDFLAMAKLIRYDINKFINHSINGIREAKKLAILSKEKADGQA